MPWSMSKEQAERKLEKRWLKPQGDLMHFHLLDL